jgi:7-cyano-7-deazaguanine synthase in queuosine biosynthesis
MNVTVSINPPKTRRDETSLVLLNCGGIETPFTLDLQLTPFLNISKRVPSLSMDFLFIASIVYAIDKIVVRDRYAEDCWTRDNKVTIPVRHLDLWTPVAKKLSSCISFLTGDRWHISFSASPRKVEHPNSRKRRKRVAFEGAAVSLLSGGLDSFIGAVDWLSDHPNDRLVLIAHHDRHVKGPMADQSNIYDALKVHFPGRFEMTQVRVGVSEKTAETSFRSRSLIFLALGTYAAELLGTGTPVIIPENGPIAFNIPLSPSRRSSCSTRTVHPRFIQAMNDILQSVGLNHPIVNPYAYKTKGEMVAECRVPSLIRSAHAMTVSCAKSGHNYWWHNRQAGACGRCVPCLFRRAALSVAGLDTQPYGFDVLSDGISNKTCGVDFCTLLAFLRRNPNVEDIAQALITNGPIPLIDLQRSVSVVVRMMAEVRTWLSASGSTRVKNLAGIDNDD